MEGGGEPQTVHRQRQVMNPVRASQSSSKSRFQGSIKSLHHPITWGVVAGCLDLGNSEDGTNLPLTYRGQVSWDSKPCNPGRNECSGTGFGGNGGEGNSLWPPGGLVDHGEDITEPMAGGQRTNQI